MATAHERASTPRQTGVGPKPFSWARFGAALSVAVDLAALESVAQRARACRLCPLAAGRTNAVPGEGDGSSGILLVGEAPGRNEDETGRPFCGSAGKNLDLGLAAAGIDRATTFVTSIVKCRPPENRDPHPEEKAACHPYLVEQIAALRPKVIVALGRHGLSGLMPDFPKAFAQLPGSFVAGPEGIPVFVSLHPAAVIYRQKWKTQYMAAWKAFGEWHRSGTAAVPGQVLSSPPAQE